jgi:hypothetical protein
MSEVVTYSFGYGVLLALACGVIWFTNKVKL